MVTITVSTVVAAPRDVVWDDLRSIASHVEWMQDAESIVFRTDATEGIGVRFDCVTRIGPIRLVDTMEVTQWQDRETMGIRHDGAVSGSGRFTLRPLDGPDGAAQTHFEWTETLSFPWWMAGPAGARLARGILRWVWTRNLRSFADRFE